MLKRQRFNVRAFYVNYSTLGITREPILIDDYVNIMTNRDPIIWSTKIYKVVKIESPLYVFLRDESDKSNEVVANAHYRMPFDTTIYRAVKPAGIGWKAINIDTGSIAYLRPYLYEDGLERVIKTKVTNLKLKKSAVPPRKRMQITGRFWDMFKF
tara:strand:+ start:971 stop:1435 length:465 start_codon:yes stop_codon:yes gene_type:complete